MTTIDVFDPALCCNSGVCGAEVDQDLVDFSGLVHWATSRGASVERHNLAQQPQDFAGNPVVAELLRTNGAAALPVTLVDGQQAVTGRYPTRAGAGRLGRAPRHHPDLTGHRRRRRRRVRAGLRHLLTDPPSPKGTAPPCICSTTRHGSCSSPARAASAKPPCPARRRSGWPGRDSGCCWSAPTRRPTSARSSTNPSGTPSPRSPASPGCPRWRSTRRQRPSPTGTASSAPSAASCPPTSWPVSRNSCPGRAPPRSPRSTSSPRCSPTRRWPASTTTSSSTPRPPGTPSGCCNCPARGAGSSTPTPKGPPAWGRWPGWRNNASGTPTPSPNCPTRPGPVWCWSPAPTAAPWTRPPAPTTNSPSSDSRGSIWSSTASCPRTKQPSTISPRPCAAASRPALAAMPDTLKALPVDLVTLRGQELMGIDALSTLLDTDTARPRSTTTPSPPRRSTCPGCPRWSTRSPQPGTVW